MYIQSMTMRGFKSFGKETNIRFLPGVNGIVGPNGSGKSNLLEAICFVMGEVGSHLRVRKSEDLFHIGKYPPSADGKTAEVELVFDGAQKETAITRTLLDDGTSKYRVNDKRVRREDIVQLLGAANLAPVYSVISQGEIERIVRMSDVQRRKIIDEIAGIAEFEEKKTKALTDLEDVKYKLSEVSAVLSEREKVLQRLEEDKKAAEKYSQLEERKKKLEVGVVATKLVEVDKAREDLGKKITQTEAAIDQLKKEIEELNKEKIKLENQIEKIEEKMRLAQGEELLVLVQEIEAKKSKLEQRRAMIKDIDDKIKENTKKLDEFGKFKLETPEYLKLTKELERIKKEKMRIDKLKEKYFGADKEKYETLKDEFEKLRVELGKREGQEKLISDEIERINAKLKKLEDENRQLEKDREDAKKRLTKLDVDKKTLETDLQDLIDRTSQVIGEINKVKPTWEKKKNELDRLSSSGMMRLTPGVRQVLASGKAGQLRGMVGLIANLFECDEKYRAALEVAAGANLMSVVMQDDKTAADAIDFLRKGKIGRVSFIPMNKIIPRLISADLRKLGSYPGVIGFAVELAKFDEQLQDVFRYVLGDTLVVVDMNSAMRIGIGRARMVTLGGDVCERSGLMTGGYYTPMVSTRDLEKDVVDLETRITQLETQRNENNDKILKIRQTLAELEVENEKLKGRMQFENLEYKLLSERKKELEDQLGQIGIKELKIEFEKIENELNVIKPPDVKELRELDQKSGEINTLEREFGLKLQEFNNRRDEVERDKKELQDSADSMENERKTASGEIKRLDSEINGLDLKIKEAKQSNSGLLTDRQKYEDKKMELEKRKLEKYQKFGSFNEELKNQKTSTIGLEHEISELGKKLSEFNIEPELGNELEAKLMQVNEDLRAMGPVNLKALDEYKLVYGEVGDTIEKKKKLEKEKRAVKRFIAEVEKNKLNSFMNVFSKTAKKFKEVFSELIDGEARLVLESKEDPLQGGMFIEARVHGKHIMLNSMSGGEKSLTALAFILAIQSHTPSPFFLFDEIDAALDKMNSEKLVEKLKLMGKDSQVIIVTHNDQVLKACNQLIGIYMKNGISEIVSVKTMASEIASVKTMT